MSRRRRTVVACLGAGLLIGGFVVGRQVGVPAASPPARSPEATAPRLGGGSVVTATAAEVEVGKVLMTGASGQIWSTSMQTVRITGVRALAGDGIELTDLRLVEASDANPGFLGQDPRGGDLQAQVDRQAAPDAIRLEPARGAELRCCGTCYDLYLQAEVTVDRPVTELLGVRIRYETTAGGDGTLDVVMPITACRGSGDDAGCREGRRRAEVAQAEANER